MSVSAISIKNGFNIYSQLSSGKRINRAADDASGLAIGQKLKRQENGLNVGAQNTNDGKGYLNVADGALDSITDQLQRMRELGLKSMNGLYSDSDREMFQTEIDQLKDSIQTIAKGTTLNEQKLLDGSMADMHLATNPDGGGLDIHMLDTTLESLGIADFDVTSGNFDLSAIDKALDMVANARSEAGAVTNRLEHTYNYNMNASEQLTAARSRIEDLDMPKAISEKQKQDLLTQYQNMMLRSRMNQKGMVMRLFQ
ncbi:MAG: flagellin [Lachnospiraceae bacterium]|nr:flagellin [Lachnospiraceae bacterium]